jgi:hypothetical protein
MVADADIQVWLDAQASVGQTIVVPYVKSVKDVHVVFRMDVIQRGGGNTSRISQQGSVNAVAATPVALAHVALGTQKNGECMVELSVREGEKQAVTYHFSCSES